MDRSAFLSDDILQLEDEYLPGVSSIGKYDIDFNQTPELPYGTQLPAGITPFAPLGSTLREISTPEPEGATRVSPEGVVQQGICLLYTSPSPRDS